MLFGQKIGKTNSLGQKALGVAKRMGKVAGTIAVAATAGRMVKTVADDQNVRQVGRLLAPGVRGLVDSALQ